MNDDVAEEIFDIILRTGSCNPITNFEQIKCTAILKSKGYLITPRAEIYEPTALGQEVLQNGSWKAYIKAKNKRQKNLDRKEYYEGLISRLKYWLFWPILILSAFGGFIEVLRFYSEYNSQDQKSSSSKIKPKMGEAKQNTSYESPKISTYPPVKVVDTLYVREKTKEGSK
ncbi:hypothetical protein [Flavobacterium daemonense]|uniref:hypothetical protein n=1 Tax=Flavobacterium daemonense TaxID=1393049 RepID=UPI0011861AE7|nr:hypothetical protein [Flavobacterium daemonense]KAF2327268.1 hypothetical protein FND99_18895 [Flavobacterium daemonense]